MKVKTPLLSGRLVKRYKRFLADVVCDVTGETLTIHCPNSGSMKGVVAPGTRVWFSRSTNVNRKLPYTWEISSEGNVLVGVNTQTPNLLVSDGLKESFFEPFREYPEFVREIRVGTETRIDFLLHATPTHPPCYIEVKNVHMNQNGIAAFPDAVTTRGTKHLETLVKLNKDGSEIDLDNYTEFDYIIDNYGTLDEFIEKIEQLKKRIEK